MLTPEARARDFPTLAGMAYLNTAAEGIPPLAVRDALPDDADGGSADLRRRCVQWW